MGSQRLLVTLKPSLLVSLAAGLLLSGGPAAHAAAITVTTTNDELNVDGDCSLREAIQAANTDAAVDACAAGSGADTIELPAGTYTFSIPGIDEDANQTGDLDITEALAISGAGAPLTIIDANALDRVFHILSGIDVTISGVTIQGGLVLSPSSGGGLLNSGKLILSDSSVRANSITGSDPSLGGGLANVGTAELTNVAFTDNALTDVQLTGGGAISNHGTLLLTAATISNNTAWTGGAIINIGSLTVAKSTLHGNSAVRAGGAIVNLDAATLTNITVSGNTATFGGGFATTGSAVATITSSTFNANGASEGGGIYNDSETATVTLTGTVIDSASGGNCGGSDPPMSAGHNLSSDISCLFAAAGDISNTDPLLGPLQDNGGATLTHALLAGSPAIDAGSPDCPPPATDQRGAARPQGSACDIGAFEVAGVGGVAELPELAGTALEAEGSSGPNATVVAVLAGVAAGALGGAAWWARRRG